MNILVTGGAGYIGSVLIPKLLKYHNITCVDNFRYGQYNALNHLPYGSRKFKLIHSDITQMHNLNEHLDWADWVIPLAALVGQPVCDKSVAEAELVNFQQIKDIVDYVNDDVGILYPNTNSGYGKVEGVCTEETPMNPISHYGKTKQSAENYLVANHAKSVVLRLATVFGISPRMRTDLMVNDFTWQAFLGFLKVYEPDACRNFVHIQDVTDVMVSCINRCEAKKHPHMTAIYNVGNDNCNMTKGELATTVCRITGAEIEFGEGEDPDQRDYEVSSAKLAEDGLVCNRTVQQGIKELVQYYTVVLRHADKTGQNMYKAFEREMKSMRNV